jgi:hypothetical protein
MRRLLLVALALSAAAPLAAQAQKSVPPFTGHWHLSLQRSKVEAAHPPLASEVVIRYDGVTWHFERTHHFAKGPDNARSFDLKVDAKTDLVENRDPLIFRSRIHRDGTAIVLVQNIAAPTGERATNTVRYSLTNHGQILIADEHEVTPAGNETNHWVFDREPNQH